MSRPTRAQQRESRRKAHERRVLIGGQWIATEVPAEDHGTWFVYNYYGCRCDPCRAASVRNKPDRRAELRRQHLARRTPVDGLLVATHLPPGRHGSPSATDYYGCQCPVCTEAAATRRSRRRKRARRS